MFYWFFLEKKTVGEKPNFEDSTLFRSPGGVFRDISNTTSTMSNNSRISLKRCVELQSISLK